MRIGHDRQLFLVAPTGPWDEVAAAVADLGLAPEAIGALAEAGTATALATAVRDAGHHLVVRADRPGTDRLVLATAEGFAAPIEEVDAEQVLVRVRWSDEAEVKADQARQLTRFAAWLNTGRTRSLILELITQDVDTVADDRTAGPEETARSSVPDDPSGHLPTSNRSSRTRRAAAPHRPVLETDLLRAIRELHDLGVEPDRWALPATEDPDLLGDAVALIKDAGRASVGVLLVIDRTDGGDRERSARTAASIEGVSGLLVRGLDGPDVRAALQTFLAAAGADT
jgi:myo-inositol catabolism protein IolC